MPRLKKRLEHDFTIINNKMLRDNKLGATERGVLITMLCLPENWNFSIKGLSKILPDGITKISTALKNLEKLGYIACFFIYYNDIRFSTGRRRIYSWNIFGTGL